MLRQECERSQLRSDERRAIEIDRLLNRIRLFDDLIIVIAAVVIIWWMMIVIPTVLA